MAKKEKSNAAEKVGSGLAHVQAFIDDVFRAGFKGLKNISSQKEKKSSPEASSETKKSEKVFDGLRKTAGFLGEMGDSYYKKYEEIKAKRSQKKK